MSYVVRTCKINAAINVSCSIYFILHVWTPLNKHYYIFMQHELTQLTTTLLSNQQSNARSHSTFVELRHASTFTMHYAASSQNVSCRTSRDTEAIYVLYVVCISFWHIKAVTYQYNCTVTSRHAHTNSRFNRHYSRIAGYHRSWGD